MSTDTTGPAERLRVDVRVPAKVNLFLAIRGTRPDGYHELVSIMQTLAIRDRLTASYEGDPSFLHPAMRQNLKVAFSHDGVDGVPDEDNLVQRAASAMLERLGNNGRVRASNALVTNVHLEKRIPVAGGMAGGSADAAAALVALNELWDVGLERDELRELAAGLGADVPFCVTGGTALATGIGTATAQVLCRGLFHWVVGISTQPLSTPRVYETFDDHCEPSGMEPDVVLQGLSTGDVELLGTGLHNDLEEAAFKLRPELRDARDAMLDAGALGAIVSGSGPTVVGLARDRPGAHQLHESVKGLFDRCEIATSPSGGPTVA